MAVAHRHLVVQHLEKVQAKLLEEYAPVIRDYIRGRHGIYALYDGSELYYVGLASNLPVRLTQHLKDRHQGLWDRFSVYLTRKDHYMRELESLLLRIVTPTGNRQIGKLPGSTSLRKDLAAEFRRRQRAELDELLGRRAKKKPAKSRNGSSRNGELPLKPYARQAFKIRAVYRGEPYEARVLRSGWIRYGDYHYATPSALGKEICGRAVNGWWMWHYQDRSGNWVRLGELRK